MQDYLFVILTAVIGLVLQFDVVKKWRYAWAIDIVQLAVAWTYNEYVKPLKDQNEKLTMDQRVEARKMAVEKAIAIAKERNIKIDQILGEQLLEMFVEVAVSKAKK